MMDDAELIEQLRGWAKDIQEGSEAIWAMDQDLKGAADRIEAMIAERDAARDAAMEEAAEAAESPDLFVFERGWSTSQDAAALATMMSVAAALRALKGKSQ